MILSSSQQFQSSFQDLQFYKHIPINFKRILQIGLLSASIPCPMWNIKRQTQLELHLLYHIKKQELTHYIQQCIRKNPSIRSLIIFNDKGFWQGDKTKNDNTQSIVASVCELNLHKFTSFSLDLGKLEPHLFDKLTKSLSVKHKFITNLLLYNTCLGDWSIECIVQAQWQFMSEFCFQNNSISCKGVRMLRKCDWKYLTILSLSQNGLKNEAVKELIKNKWKRLKVLYLTDNKLTDDGLRTLTRASWSGLEALHLENNLFTARCVQSLMLTGWSNEVRVSLSFASNISVEQIQASRFNTKLNQLNRLQDQQQGFKHNQKLERTLDYDKK